MGESGNGSFTYTLSNSLNEASKNDFSNSSTSNDVVNKPVKDRIKGTSGSKVIGYTSKINKPATVNEEHTSSLSAKIRNI
ncbi:hypothetical protein Tco_1143502 [Tanacetum coccineum]